MYNPLEDQPDFEAAMKEGLHLEGFIRDAFNISEEEHERQKAFVAEHGMPETMTELLAINDILPNSLRKLALGDFPIDEHFWECVAKWQMGDTKARAGMIRHLVLKAASFQGRL